MKQAIYILFLLLVSVFGIYAQSSTEDPQPKQAGSYDQKFDQLFNQIVQTIPDKRAGFHDSVNQLTRTDNHRPETPVSPEMMRDRRDQMTKELPDELRKQVERAINDINLKKVEHAPSFIENRPVSK